MISIGLPIVKTKFLVIAIESILNQSYKDFELVILNNGKNCGEKKEIKNLIDKYTDNRIKYFENEKQLPIVQNWNKCLSYTQRKYFILFSDDDIYETEFLSEMINLSEKYPKVDLFHTRVYIIDEQNQITHITPVCPEFEEGFDFIYSRITGKRGQFAPDFMTNTSKLKKNGGFYYLPHAWGSDDITWFLLSKNGVAYSSKVLCKWRSSGINESNSSNLLERIEANQKYYDFMLELINDGDLFKNFEIISQKQFYLANERRLENSHIDLINRLRTHGRLKKIHYLIKLIFNKKIKNKTILKNIYKFFM